ncbi:MAG: cytochrome c-type biogenesis protein CcmH [Acidobacteriota bacterium]
MRRNLILVPLVVLVFTTSMPGNPANGDPRLEKLFQMFISPCCWRENLLVHHSPSADELRAEIRRLAREGRTDNEIKAALIEQHTIRILSFPDGARGKWLSYMPVAVGLAGLGIVGIVMKRSLRPRGGGGPTVTDELPDIEWGWDPAPEQRRKLR